MPSFTKGKNSVILREQVTIALGTLNANTGIKVDTGQYTMTEDFRMLKSVVSCHIEGLTAGEGSGLQLGLANGELTVAEIKECLTADGPTNPTDREQVEFASRFCKVVSQLDWNITQVNGIMRGENGSPLIVVKPRWTFTDTNGWSWFMYNDGPANLATGATVRLLCTHFGVWLK